MSLIPLNNEKRRLLLNEEEEFLSTNVKALLKKAHLSTITEQEDKPRGLSVCTIIEKPSANEKEVNVALPDTALSDRNLIAEINRAGLLFIEQDKCPPINMYSKTIKIKERDFDDVKSAVDMIVAGISGALTTLVSGTAVSLVLNSADLKIIVTGILKGIFAFKSFSSEESVDKCTPLVTKGNEVAWMKYQFSANISIKKRFFFSEKFLNFEVKSYWFYYPTIEDFEHSLEDADRENSTAQYGDLLAEICPVNWYSLSKVNF